MANSMLSPKVYANTFLKLMKNNLVAAKLVSGEFKDIVVKPISNTGQRNGTTVYVKRPPEFTVRDGAVASVQDVVEGEIALTIDKQKGIDVEFTSMEETLSVDSLLKSKIMGSAAAKLANQIDMDIHAETKKFYSWVGTPGTAITTYAGLTKAMERADIQAIETSGRVGFLHPTDAWGMIGGLSALQQDKIVGDALTSAKLPILGGVDWYATQNAGTVTTGTKTGGAIDGASQNVTYASVASGNWTQSLIVKTLGSSKTLAIGDSFTIANVYMANPMSKVSTGVLQQFVVTATKTTTTGNTETITVSPPIITSGAFQTVVCTGTDTTAPDDSATITWLGTLGTTYRFGTLFRPEAIALASAKLIMPYSGEADYSTDPDTGLTVRYWRSSDSTNDTHLHRFDVVYGVKNVDPRRGVRVSGT
jgi:hypothetical protein